MSDPIEYGAICERCGLSEFGLARMRAVGFNPRPCGRCPEELRDEDEETT